MLSLLDNPNFNHHYSYHNPNPDSNLNQVFNSSNKT